MVEVTSEIRELVWASLTTKRVYKIPFICERCGKCCYWFGVERCPHLVGQNICGVYGARPEICRDYPLHGAVGAYKTCGGYRLAMKAGSMIAWVGIAIMPWQSYIQNHHWDKEFPPSDIEKQIDKLRRHGISESYLDKLREVNIKEG